MGASNKVWRNAYISDLSVANISVSGNIIPLFNLSGSLGGPSKLWGNAYIRDLSASTIDISTNLNPLTNNSGSVGASNKIWNNAHLRDVSVSNAISICGDIIPALNINSNLGSLANRWKFIYSDDLSINKINGATYTATSSIDISSVSSDIIPTTTNTYNLGSSSIYWKNAYIRDLSISNPISISGNIVFNICGGNITNLSRLRADVSNNIITTTHRIYQEISGDISWNSVNGYYGLAKDAYPRNTCPYLTQSRIFTAQTAVSSWTGYASSNDSNAWRNVCWSPELGLFVATAEVGTNRVMTSPDGITWTGQTVPNNYWLGVCWSPQKSLFVAVAEALLRYTFLRSFE